ncbi:hypothetical protein BUALT_Bualt18G0034300 [Buddleja alternifolia]|uniref:KIB1-4 beta-propeller domain-containing protein n=1 Tax=Buddleja alternifolia TaxID=168488 RepID=A0AAV6W4C0_9LAMI|nr:hypothetical protein BUALT_Bualt18G0034300 [Buddleja alternifolia]
MGWSDLPMELLSLILSRLLLMRDRHAFKAVCKSWTLIAPVKSAPLSLPPSDDSPYYDSPCLIISQGSNHSWKLFHSVYNDFYYLDFPELIEAEIRFSKYGWLLMSRGNMLFFFNPFTKVKMELPPAISPFVFVSFSLPPTSKDCLVFGIHSTSSTHSTDLDKSGNICIYDPDKPEHPPIQYDNCHLTKFGEELQQCYMAEVEGEIWGVFVMMDKSICIEKLNLGKRFCFDRLDYEYAMKWVTLKSLGKKCFYVGPNGSFAETCTVKGMTNAIYFNKLHGCSGVLYSRSSGKYHSVDGEYTGEASNKLTETSFNSTWIKPPRSTWI